MRPAERINPAELELRPYLDRLEAAQHFPSYVGDYNDRLQDALQRALELLDVALWRQDPKEP